MQVRRTGVSKKQLEEAAAVHERSANRLLARAHVNAGNNTNAQVAAQERSDADKLRAEARRR